MSGEKKSFDSALFESDNVWGILWKVAPPVMLAQLIQALYNIVDSYFVGKYSADGLTALSVVYPIQLAMTALSVGTGVGVNSVFFWRVSGRRSTRPGEICGFR